MKLRSVLIACVAVAAMLIPYGAYAHVLNESGGSIAGFSHPFFGADHVLAMLAVGFWAAQTGARAMWAVPLTFVSMMGGGALVALAGIPLPVVESGTAASVLVLGLLVAFAIRLPLAAGMMVTGAFAVFHGHSHGSELPAMASPWLYVAGFLAATGLLHVSGIVTARVLNAKRLRFAGACVALAGAALIAS